MASHVSVGQDKLWSPMQEKQPRYIKITKACVCVCVRETVISSRATMIILNDQFPSY